MILLMSSTANGLIEHWVAPDSIVRITEAGVSSQWHGTRSFVYLFDGSMIECRETASDIVYAIFKARGEG